MAHHKHKPVPPPQISGPSRGTGQPTTIGGALQPATIGGADLVLFNENQSVVVVGQLRAPISAPLPKPRYDNVDRFDAVSSVHWRGREPYEMTVPLRFDEFPNGHVEPQITRLTTLALRYGDNEPLKVGLVGPVPTPIGMSNPPMWRIVDMTESEPALYTTAGTRCRFSVDITLREAADASQLSTTPGKGVRTSRREIHKGESLYHFAKRVTGKRSNATVIALANNIRVSYVAHKATQLKVP